MNEAYVAMGIEKGFIAKWQDYEIKFSDAPIPLLPNDQPPSHTSTF